MAAPERTHAVRADADADTSSGDASAPTCCVFARDLLRGCVAVDELPYGWVRPWRFTTGQRRALSSCLAWYPGIFRQMATTTAGVRLEFETDATELFIEVRTDREPRATRNVLKGMKREAGDARLAHDGFSFDVNGEHRDGVVPLGPVVGSYAAAVGAAGHGDEWSAGITLELGERKRLGNLVELPGFGSPHRVRVWLPALRGCELGRVAGNGTFVRPVPDADAGSLLVLGDSVAQGFTTGDPALAWPSLIARELGLSLVNQSVGAQVFQESSVAPLSDCVAAPKLVIVALGANYRYGRCNASLVGREILAHLERVDELWPSVPLMVLTPHVGSRKPVAGSCFEEVPHLIGEAVARVRRRRIAASAPAVLVSATPWLDERLISDEDGHPTAAGDAVIARFVLGELPKLECRCLAETGRYGRCGACAGIASVGNASAKGAASAGSASANDVACAGVASAGAAGTGNASAKGAAGAAVAPTAPEAAPATDDEPVTAPSMFVPTTPAPDGSDESYKLRIEDTPAGQTISMFALLDDE